MCSHSNLTKSTERYKETPFGNIENGCDIIHRQLKSMRNFFINTEKEEKKTTPTKKYTFNENMQRINNVNGKQNVKKVNTLSILQSFVSYSFDFLLLDGRRRALDVGTLWCTAKYGPTYITSIANRFV